MTFYQDSEIVKCAACKGKGYQRVLECVLGRSREITVNCNVCGGSRYVLRKIHVLNLRRDQ